MSYDYFKAKFHFSNDELSESKKKLAIAQFNAMREIVVDQTDPLLEYWNEEWGTDALDENHDPYIAFMKEKFKPYIDGVNNSHPDFDIYLDTDEDLDIIGIFKEDGSKMYFTLEPIDTKIYEPLFDAKKLKGGLIVAGIVAGGVAIYKGYKFIRRKLDERKERKKREEQFKEYQKKLEENSNTIFKALDDIR